MLETRIMTGKVTPALSGPAVGEAEAEAMDRLDRVRGIGGMKAALLALLLSPALPRRLRIWREETAPMPEAEEVRADVERLGPTTRLPWFELLLARMGASPLQERQALLRSARRVLGPPGQPIDRLLWLAMRRQFGEHPDAKAHVTPDPDVSRLTIAEVLHVAHFSAHLARMVPSEDPTHGQAWYQVVMSRWLKPAETPPWQRPDVDALVHALNGLQLMSWMQRPQVVRTWVAAAKQITPGALDPVAADALRLSSLLLDSPMPPDLARQYAEVDPD
ncbi:MAG: hypothetical protein KA766_05235 [Piscinibacter sp.]|uniref:hypothetical protein n=1 Tax=Piscinibacter sp. TaxID=1903157 RepID=UPI001B5D6976|nr:hypothetical protein [Piscinibacter sp.]MBP5989391.1 hypothetical protein [Piscinibacter sp.]MBP6027348.1 hypothetical protein [Piscinibacter sp.]